jgi:hypothetical protein
MRFQRLHRQARSRPQIVLLDLMFQVGARRAAVVERVAAVVMVVVHVKLGINLLSRNLGSVDMIMIVLVSPHQIPKIGYAMLIVHVSGSPRHRVMGRKLRLLHRRALAFLCQELARQEMFRQV